LITEFDKVLSGGEKYSVLPLARLCESNPAVAEGLESSRTSRFASLTSLADNMLKRSADVPTDGQEVISRVGLGLGTLDDAGNQALCRPTNKHRETLGEVTGSKRKAIGDQVPAAKRSLNNLLLSQLRNIVRLEKVVMPEKTRLLKEDYVNAILKARAPAGLHHNANNSVDEEEGRMDVVGDAADEAASVTVPAPVIDDVSANEREVTAKKFISVNNVTQLKAIVSKLGVVMGPGRKTKTDYVDAIYLAKHSQQH